ncbi:MAG: bifunctional diaminohydroxyphosphoribosylaminopyrimidine deaminase/5-amino-6-(5-phosphoribosylamino)uracil reductase RibD [Candidatus Cloacimonadales bacterium]|jgi:diaminohydroxyphosphoribosylaminopyrimidine deaminase/5-amino-6-(5-phosphoribosylamino)uracil reductase|nr:bifunctional diaminohydroxyphosphoribosylaminopyrimidine deaminase/5-amino-6-(5-phosphoribosylamino)uracil reductase RibD [Candidatus Cloacimonadota bacterium]MDY0380794.1 bifunctional diaminohydroxyphosphoribosylaminopyrimidine deaminase/5-amino-6-(5-phosphoribosylamino)uracil reductase RibD [Candidatus Cloacimonadaceae bacterium]HCM15521.1 bifunctional diaminohydroxyphosphoribosylaminopyrimidine deaminase/5-amino-6-(5-phosphoribosylamino)uracil reductase RibD [Candidatus Cloacimonas sp.]MCB
MDKYYMKLAIRKAEESRGKCSPNPFVGAIIVKDGKTIGEGSTMPYGKDHAEIVALREAGSQAKGATMYVSLEPCCHIGKTPPCTEAIIKSGISRVVVGILDPNPLVAGKGIKALKEAGIEVVCGFFEETINVQLEYYLCYMLKKRPFVIWKTALSLDGKYAASDGSSRWITNPASRRQVHKLRAEVEVVLAGINSVSKDNAMLNVRGLRNVKQPLRVVLDPLLDISEDAMLVKSAQDYPAMIFYHQGEESKLQTLRDAGLKTQKISGHKDELDLYEVMQVLWEMKLYSVLLETGNRLSEAFWKAKLVDKCMIFYGNRILGGDKGSLKAYDRKNIDRAIQLHNVRIRKLQDNVLVCGYPLW